VSRDWRLYVEDMIDCCQKIIDYNSGLDMLAFKNNSLVYDATLRNLEILGEAAACARCLRISISGWRMRRFGTSSITRSRNCCPFLRAFRMKFGESL
jgi:Ribonuclease HepT-like